MKKSFVLTGVFFSMLLLAFSVPVFADDAEDEALRKMQEKLNAEVMEQPFMAARPEEVDKYIKEAQEKNLKPEEYKGKHWRTGYTCRNLLRYSWHEYRNCRYYHHYHGRYYR